MSLHLPFIFLAPYNSACLVSCLLLVAYFRVWWNLGRKRKTLFTRTLKTVFKVCKQEALPHPAYGPAMSPPALDFFRKLTETLHD